MCRSMRRSRVSFVCPTCGDTHEIPLDLIGKDFHCKKSKKWFLAPLDVKPVEELAALNVANVPMADVSPRGSKNLKPMLSRRPPGQRYPAFRGRA